MVKTKVFINGREFEFEADKPVDLVELVKSLDANPVTELVKTKRPYHRRATTETKATRVIRKGRTRKEWSNEELDTLWNACMSERKTNGKFNFPRAVKRAASQLPGRSYIAIRVRASDLYYALTGNRKSSTNHMRKYVASKQTLPLVGGSIRIPVQEA
jgi:hypothetical protein